MRNSLKKQSALLFALPLVLLVVGCGPEENAEQLKLVNENLERVNGSTRYENKLIMNKWQDRFKDPQTTDLAERYLPRINKIHLYADSLMIMLEGIKSEIISQSDSLKREYVTIVKQLYIDNGVGSKLFMNLAAFSDSIPALIHPNEPAIKHLPEGIPLLPGYADSLTAKGRVQYEKNWLEKCFGRSSSLMAMIMLNKIENDVLTTEKMLYEYCESNFCIMPFRYSKYKALAVLSSSYVKNGQPIEITAGVGAFIDIVKPRITIDGKVVKLNENDATAVYQIIADGKPGTHTVMVKIEFYKPDGSREYVAKNLKYTIADEK